MRSDLPPFQRAKPPRTDEFNQQLEKVLIEEMKDHPPHRQAWRRSIIRLGRFLVRPALPGALIVTAALLVATSVQTPNDPLAADLATGAQREDLSSGWVEVLEVPDPSPGYTPALVYVAPSPRFAHLVPSTPLRPTPDQQEIVAL